MWNRTVSIYKVRAVLRVKGPGVETADVSRRLALDGRLITARDGLPEWVYFSSDEVDELQILDVHLRHVLDHVRTKAQALRWLRARFAVDLLANYMSESDYAGFEISQAALQELGRLHLDLRFVGYCFVDQQSAEQAEKDKGRSS